MKTMRKMTLVSAMIGMGASSALVNAQQVISAWDHSFHNFAPVSHSQPGGIGTPITGYGENDAHVNSAFSVSELTLGSSFTSLETVAPPLVPGPSGGADMVVPGNWDVTGFTGTGGANEYFEFTIGSSSAQAFTVTRIVSLGNILTGPGSPGPSSIDWSLTSSLDAFATSVGSASVSSAFGFAYAEGDGYFPDGDFRQHQGPSVMLDSSFANLTSPVTFRVTPSMTGGNTNGIYTMNRITVFTIPEPSSTGLLGLSALCLLIHRKR